MQNLVWKALATGAAMGGAFAARKAATALWSQFSDDDAPVNPADRTISWSSALGWALVAGLAAGVARVVARRGAAAGWHSVTGETPPGLTA